MTAATAAGRTAAGRTAADATVTFPVALHGPVDVPASVEFLRRRGDDLLDRWDGERLVRALTVRGHRIAVAMRPFGSPAAPSLHVTVPARAVREVGTGAVRAAVAAQFVLPPPCWSTLLAADPVLAELDRHAPTIRPLTLTDPLYALTRSITAQQVNLTFATTIRGRLAHLVGVPHEVDGAVVRTIDADRLAGASVTELRRLQLSERKARYLIGAAVAVRSGIVDVAAMADMDDATVIATLTALHGIGRWTAEWFLIRVLGRPAVVAGDVAVRKAVGRLYGVDLATEPHAREVTAHWGGAAHIAQQLVLDAST